MQYIKLHEDQSVTFNLYGSADPQLEGTRFHYFRQPEQPLNYDTLLTSDLIIYCAGAGVQSSKKYPASLIYDVNAFEPIRIINALTAAAYTGKIVTFGSYFEIGNNNAETQYKEEEVALASAAVPNDYCISKRILTRFLDSSNTPINWFHLILSSIYGKGENENRLIPYVTSKILAGEEVKLSSGNQVRQYIHADDVNAFILSLYKNEVPSGMYNLASETGITVKELVEHIEETLQKKGNLQFGDLVKTDQSMNVLLLNIEKIKKTGWKPTVSLAQGITEYI